MVSGASLLQSVLSLSIANPVNLTRLFGPSLSPGAQIILPTDSKWDTQVRARWSNYQAPTYLGAIKPATETDIQHIVRASTDCMARRVYDKGVKRMTGCR